MSRDVPELGDAEWERIAETLAAWSQAHPRPHLPVVQLADFERDARAWRLRGGENPA
jgi:hypothetical protein